MTTKLNEERAAIEEAQDALGAFKSAMRKIEKINTKAGRHLAASAAMGLRGKAIVLHDDATQALYANYPGFAQDISTRGGGDR